VELSPEEAPVAAAEETAAEGEYCTTKEEAAALLRQALISRKERFTILYRHTGSYTLSTLGRSIFNLALTHTGVPDEGDSLMWGWKQRSYEAATNRQEGNDRYLALTFVTTYYTTAEQEAALNTAVDELLVRLDLEEKSDYGKIRGIYDYICENVTYDRTSSGYLKYTPYAALVNGTAVCQGYAVLFYRLALELGLDTRVIFGQSGQVNHAWNIVRLGDTWFCLDATWDAGNTDYTYFLKGEENFANHTRMDNAACLAYYTRTSFYAAYPTAQNDYIRNSVPDAGLSGTCGENAFWRLGADGRLVVYGSGTVPGEASGQWAAYADGIRDIYVTDGITEIGAGTFSDCTMVPAVGLSPSTSAEEGAFSDSTEVYTVSPSEMSLILTSGYAIAAADDGRKYLIADTDGSSIADFAEQFTGGAGTSQRFQLVSSDGSVRYSGSDKTAFGTKFQLLDREGFPADEVTIVRKGDMNLDGTVDTADAVMLLWSFVNPAAYRNVLQYDLNGDGAVNTADAAYLYDTIK